MKLFQRENGYWYISFGHNKVKSTGTKNQAEAKRIFNSVKTTSLKENIFKIESVDNITLLEAIELYIKGRHDLSSETEIKDRVSLKLFGDSIGHNILISKISDDSISKFKLDSVNRGLEKVSINSYLRHIRAFLNAMYKAKYLKEKVEVKLLKVGESLPRFLTDNERKAILQYALKNNIELYRIINFALYTGCRAGEIAKADYSDVINYEKIKVKGKGQKERFIPLLSQTLDVMGCPLPIEGNIFNMSADTMSRHFKVVVRALGFDDLHFHHLRHTAATYMVASGMELLYVQYVLGHSDIKTTLIYAHIVQNSLKKQMANFNYENTV